MIRLIVAPPLNSTMMKVDELCAILANTIVNATGGIKMKQPPTWTLPRQVGNYMADCHCMCPHLRRFHHPSAGSFELHGFVRFVNLFGHGDAKGGSTKGGDSKCICKHMKIHSLRIYSLASLSLSFNLLYFTGLINEKIRDWYFSGGSELVNFKDVAAELSDPRLAFCLCNLTFCLCWVYDPWIGKHE